MSEIAIAPSIPEESAQALAQFSPRLQQLLFNRSIKTSKLAESYLNPNYDTELHDPFLLNDMDKAVERILLAIKKSEKIIIFSDYDCDGIPGGVILHDFFKEVGFDNFTNVIPHRHYDGFGLSTENVESIIDKHQPDLLITIDCGSTDIEAVALANQKGLDIIITDHHEPPAVLPEAVALVNPKVGSTYPFTELCGAAVVFKLVQALIAKGEFELVAGFEKWWLDMVGVATIADMVPLRDENRVLAYYGLQVLRKSRRPGLQQLFRKQNIKQNLITEDDIGFTIGPRINAASRMDTPEDAFNLLATKDEGEAGAHLAHLEKLNNERKGAVASMTKELHKRLKNVEELPAVLVFGNPDWRPSLVGLTANKLAEEFNRPAFVWGRDGNGKYKGSCRSDGLVSVVKLMQSASEIFSEYGGHNGAGGFTVLDEHIHSVGDRLVQAFTDLGSEAVVVEPVFVDMELTLSEVDRDLLKAQKQCAPFGLENNKPVYLIKDIEPTEVSAFGKTKEHTKILFNGSPLVREAIAFFKTPEQYNKEPKVGQKLSLLTHLEESYFMGRVQTRLRIIDIV